MDQERSKAQKWREDNRCTLNGEPAKIVGWSCDFPTIAQINGPVSHQWSWAAVNRIMERDRKFRS